MTQCICDGNILTFSHLALPYQVVKLIESVLLEATLEELKHYGVLKLCAYRNFPVARRSDFGEATV